MERSECDDAPERDLDVPSGFANKWRRNRFFECRRKRDCGRLSENRISEFYAQ